MTPLLGTECPDDLQRTGRHQSPAWGPGGPCGPAWQGEGLEEGAAGPGGCRELRTLGAGRSREGARPGPSGALTVRVRAVVMGTARTAGESAERSRGRCFAADGRDKALRAERAVAGESDLSN